MFRQIPAATELGSLGRMGRTDGFPKIGIFAVFLGGSEIACLNDYQVRQRKKRIPTFPFLDWCFWWCSIAHPERGQSANKVIQLNAAEILTSRCRRRWGAAVFDPFSGFEWVLVGRTVFGKPPPRLNSGRYAAKSHRKECRCRTVTRLHEKTPIRKQQHADTSTRVLGCNQRI